MGNGFTFELESLLFYTIVRAVAYFTGTPGVVSVYGDDIICPQEITSLVIWALEYFGFQVNTEKSCIDGPYRESCGGHYRNGYDITPFYIRKPIERLTDLIDIANKLRQWGGDGFDINGRLPIDFDVEEIWLWLKSFVPNDFWGGSDLSFKFQLVSLDTPRFRLQEETESKGTGNGGYLQWHNATWDRTYPGDGVETSSFTKNLGTLRKRRVRNQVKPRIPQLFLHEIVGVTGQKEG
jgi:hypothetical protein